MSYAEMGRLALRLWRSEERVESIAAIVVIVATGGLVWWRLRSRGDNPR